MKIFKDKNLVCAASLREQQGPGLEIHWTCLQDPAYQVEGFLICYTVEDSIMECEKMISLMDEEELLQKIENKEWAGEGTTCKVAFVDPTLVVTGFYTINMKAPCKIAIWTVARELSGKEVVILAKERADTVCVRKLTLKYQQKIRTIDPIVHKGFLGKTKVIEPGYKTTTLVLSRPEQDSCYRDGAVVYWVEGCEKPFPFTRETLGKELKFKNCEPRIAVNREYSSLYKLEKES